MTKQRNKVIAIEEERNTFKLNDVINEKIQIQEEDGYDLVGTDISVCEIYNSVRRVVLLRFKLREE